ncbi:MAG: shikimate kinase [Actinophytocola sp.]|nr:shikimate kinase [Actinophytocola sp.]
MSAVTARSPQVVLIGPPGSGKSTVGRLLAQRLGCGFADADADIEAKEGRKIPDIFTEDGEPYFREVEERIIAEGLVRHDGVFSLGGGAVLSAATRKHLAGHTVVFLTVGLTVGMRRTGLSTARPLLAGVNPRATFKALLDERMPLYREVSTIEVATDERIQDEVVDEILVAYAREVDRGAAGHRG